MVLERVMRSRRIPVFLLMTLMLNNTVFAVFSTATGYSSTELFSSTGTYTTCGGLDIDSGSLYFGNYSEIKSLNLSDNSVSTVGSIGGNAGNALVVRHSNLTYTAYGTSYDEPYPYKMGYIDGEGTYNNQLDEDGIYDAAVSPNGDCYIVANPDALGSQIFKYDWTTGATTLIADIGGSSGGLAFDDAGNLYYADQGEGERDASILKFTAMEVAAGSLDASDADSFFDIAAGYIVLDDDGVLYATTGWGATLAKYDFSTESMIEEIAYGSIGKLMLDGDYIYAIDTDWGSYSSTIQRIVPEPATIILLGLSGLWLRRRRK
jgi:hypothetical protein